MSIFSSLRFCLITIGLTVTAAPTNSAIIGEESRDYMTKEEYRQVGQSVGLVTCLNQFHSTGYLVASDVVRLALHSLYEVSRDKPRPRNITVRKKAELERDCTFTLANRAFSRKWTFSFTAHTACAELKSNAPTNCDWVIAKLDRRAPDTSVPLSLLTWPATKLDSTAVVAVGHHCGEIEGIEADWKYKLIDFGTIVPKTKESYIRAAPRMVQYTVDTSGCASGQPILIQIKDNFFAVASHTGEFKFRKANAAAWNDANHMNYGEINTVEMLTAIRTHASRSEQYRFTGGKTLGHPRQRIQFE